MTRATAGTTRPTPVPITIEEQMGPNKWKVMLMLKRQVLLTLVAIHHEVGDDLIEEMENPDQWVWVTALLKTTHETLAAMNGRIDIWEVDIDIKAQEVIRAMPEMFDLLEGEGTIEIREQKLPLDSNPFLRPVTGPAPTEPQASQA